MAASTFRDIRGNPLNININLPKISECCALFKIGAKFLAKKI